MRFGVLACVLAGALGCTEKRPEKRSAPVLALADAAAPPVAFVDTQFVTLARAAVDAAAALAASCTLHAEWQDEFRRYTDVCRWKPVEQKTLKEAAEAVRRAAPDGGDGAVFAENLRLFAAWVDATGSSAYSLNTGTLAHYQDLALAWNAFRPSDPVNVDPKTKVRGENEGLEDLAAGPKGHLDWIRCSDGPCIIVPRTDRRAGR